MVQYYTNLYYIALEKEPGMRRDFVRTQEVVEDLDKLYLKDLTTRCDESWDIPAMRTAFRENMDYMLRMGAQKQQMDRKAQLLQQIEEDYMKKFNRNYN